MDTNIVVSSRIRLARNLHDTLMPHKLDTYESDRVVDEVIRAVDRVGDFDHYRLKDLSEVEINMAIENNEISKELKNNPRAAYLRSVDEVVTIMILEEDHIRLQCTLDGLALRKAYDIASDIDLEMNKSLDFAYSRTLGYLTACPSNVGTGMRASVMLFLPALTLAGSIGDIIATVSKMGLTLRGSRGEGSSADHYLYQLSNEITLGKSESDIITLVESTVNKLVELEENAREDLIDNNFDTIMDKCHRAYGILTNAYTISSSEAIELIGSLRLGVGLKLINIKNSTSLQDITNNIKPYHIENMYGKRVDDATRDRFRAQYLREIFKSTLIE